MPKLHFRDSPFSTQEEAELDFQRFLSEKEPRMTDEQLEGLVGVYTAKKWFLFDDIRDYRKNGEGIDTCPGCRKPAIAREGTWSADLYVHAEGFRDGEGRPLAWCTAPHSTDSIVESR